MKHGGTTFDLQLAAATVICKSFQVSVLQNTHLHLLFSVHLCIHCSCLHGLQEEKKIVKRSINLASQPAKVARQSS